jgi:hypothetical protein
MPTEQVGAMNRKTTKGEGTMKTRELIQSLIEIAYNLESGGTDATPIIDAVDFLNKTIIAWQEVEAQ